MGCKVKIPIHVVKKSEHGKADKTYQQVPEFT